MPPFFDPLVFGAELVFTVVAVAFCFAVYLRTKESYELTRYRGIMYFRDAFLFFGLSYLTRFFFGLLLFSSFTFDVFLPRRLLMPLFILPLGYFSTVGILYLVFSSIWKKFDGRSLPAIAHGTAALLSVLAFVSRSHFILLYLQSILLVLAVVAGFFMQKLKGMTQTRTLYILVFALWLINLWIVGRMRPFSFELEFFAYLVSVSVFIAIYHKVSKLVR